MSVQEEKVFNLIWRSTLPFITWPIITSVMLWIIRPDMGSEWVVHRGCAVGFTIAGVVVGLVWSARLIFALDSWRARLRQRSIDRALAKLDEEDD